jgi:hypothetical protein
VRENSTSLGLDWFVLEPVFQIFRKSESGRVSALWIFLQALQANGGKIAIYFRIPQTRFPGLGV